MNFFKIYTKFEDAKTYFAKIEAIAVSESPKLCSEKFCREFCGFMDLRYNFGIILKNKNKYFKTF
jgi:hypothetical protein